MVLNVFALLFVLGITFMNSMFGLYSGLINLFSCVLSAAVAFGFFEPLNNLFVQSFHLHPAYTEPFALVLPFAVTLLVLRLLADNLIRGNVRVPMYVDWAGGAVCGFFIAQICVGVMTLSFLLLPWGGRVAMYQPIERDSDNATDPDTGRVHFNEKQLWLQSDRFTVALIDLLGKGSLSNWVDEKRNDLATVYPDFPQWVRWTGNTVQLESLTAPIVDEKGDGFKNGIKVESWWPQKGAPTSLAYRKVAPSKGNDKPEQVEKLYDKDFKYKLGLGKQLIGARLTLRRDSADRDGSQQVHRFRPTMLRVVGRLRDEPRDYVAQIIGGADSYLGENLRVADPDANFTIPAPDIVRVDVYFEVDEGFVPRFIEYRRHARAALTKAEAAKEPPGERIAAPVRDEKGNVRAQGIFRFVDLVEDSRKRGNSDALPFPLSETAAAGHGENAEFEGQLFASGRVMGERAALASDKPDVTRFKVPEGKWICQIPVQARKVKSLAGKIFNFVGGTVNQYQALSRENDVYWLAGYYAIVKRGDQETVELFFTPDPEGTGSRGMLEWKHIQRPDLEHDDTVFGLIFVVPKGKCILSIKPGSNRDAIPIGEDLCE